MWQAWKREAILAPRHRLPIKSRMNLKTPLLTYQVLRGQTPSQLGAQMAP